jgi:hypothetical protein
VGVICVVQEPGVSWKKDKKNSTQETAFGSVKRENKKRTVILGSNCGLV